MLAIAINSFLYSLKTDLQNADERKIFDLLEHQIMVQVFDIYILQKMLLTPAFSSLN